MGLRRILALCTVLAAVLGYGASVAVPAMAATSTSRDRLGAVRQPVPGQLGGGHLPAGLRQLRQPDRAEARDLRWRFQLHGGAVGRVHRGHARRRRLGLEPAHRLHQLHGERRDELHRGQPRARRGPAARGAEGRDGRAQGPGARPGHPGLAEAGSGHDHRRRATSWPSSSPSAP